MFTLLSVIISFAFGLVLGLIMFLIILIANALKVEEIAYLAHIVSALWVVYVLALFTANFSIFVRRMHDIGKSGWVMLLIFVPFIGPIILLIWLCQIGQVEENKYGPAPIQ